MTPALHAPTLPESGKEKETNRHPGMKPQPITPTILWVRIASATTLAFLLLFIGLWFFGKISSSALSFTLTDQDGETYSSHHDPTMKLVFFGFTQCADICPLAITNMRETYDIMGKEALNLRPINISVDPERDTPDALKAYVRNFGPQLMGLTGEPGELQRIYKQFAVYAKKVSPSPEEEYIIDHTAHFYLLDTDDTLLKVFEYHMPPDQMAKSIRRQM